jgi:Transposase DDE domain group 1
MLQRLAYASRGWRLSEEDGVRAAIPKTNSLAACEFATLRERLIKIGARVIEHIARIRVQLPTSCLEGALFRAVAAWPDAVRTVSHGAACPDEPSTRQINP